MISLSLASMKFDANIYATLMASTFFTNINHVKQPYPFNRQTTTLKW